MAKTKTQYVCQSCGAAQPRWMGKCPACDEWNSLVEEILPGKGSTIIKPGSSRAQPSVLADIPPERASRTPSAIPELDRVLGGGFVAGTTVLIGGDPGIGKSTLLLQAASTVAAEGVGVLYITAEEAPAQLRLRADRLELPCRDFQVLGEADAATGLNWAHEIKPALVVIDSIQTSRRSELESAPGTVSQVREVANLWADYARESGATVALVGHVTKEGSLAGPRVIEHIVDTVLMFESDSLGSVRILRVLKNRHGATGELGVFEMSGRGLISVSDPSQRFLHRRDTPVSGVSVAPVIRGARPLMIELQALVTSSPYAAPQRNATGVDQKRLAMWIAVLEKQVGLGLAGRDIFFNATGGVRLDDSGADLAACAAIHSSLTDRPLDPATVLIGEVGLTGEIRAAPAMDRRLSEAAHRSFKRAVVPKGSVADIPKGIDVAEVTSLEHAIETAMARGEFS